MSRIGKLPIKIPENVNIDYEQSKLIVKGKFGTLSRKIPRTIKVEQNSNKLVISRNDNTRITRSLHGLYRTLINNMIIGVSEQFQVTLILQGVGYRANVQGKLIILNLGYSHPIKIEIPDEISVDILQNTNINIKGCDKINLGLFASTIRFWRQPEPYKGKGVLYKNEIIIRKAGKSGKK
mmetsp:Transcript_27990/g.43078  ORF Transcript_27990/g.43078 Transcript_27990/m.43078 type:complete len:180 (-) Transcript_27990:2253-2792(-)